MTTATKNTKKKGTRAASPRAQKAAAPALLPELPVYSREGKEIAKIALPAELFGAPWGADLVHQVISAMQANKRQNRAHTKDRSEVAGGGKKPWKQKGTGQARHGSSRSPIWRHGGITFGPRTERNYHEKINRKSKAAALVSVLSKKAADGELLLVDSFGFSAPKTAAARQALSALAKGSGVEDLSARRTNAALIALAGHDVSAVKSFRNMGNVATEEVRNLNPLDLLSYKYLVIENPAESFKALAGRLTP